MKRFLLTVLFFLFSICAMGQERWTGAAIFTQPDSLRASAVSVLDEPVCSIQLSFYPAQVFPFESSRQLVRRETDDQGTLWLYIGKDLIIHLIPIDVAMRWRYSRHIWRGDAKFAFYAWVDVYTVEAGEERNREAGGGYLTVVCLPISSPGPRIRAP